MRISPPPPPPLVGEEPIAKFVPVRAERLMTPVPEPVLHMVVPDTADATVTQDPPFQYCMTEPLAAEGAVKQTLIVPLPGMVLLT